MLYRKISRRAKENVRNQYEKSLQSWLDGVRSNILESTKNTSVQSLNQKRQMMAEKFLKYKNEKNPFNSSNKKNSNINLDILRNSV